MIFLKFLKNVGIVLINCKENDESPVSVTKLVDTKDNWCRGRSLNPIFFNSPYIKNKNKENDEKYIKFILSCLLVKLKVKT